MRYLYFICVILQVNQLMPKPGSHWKTGRLQPKYCMIKYTLDVNKKEIDRHFSFPISTDLVGDFADVQAGLVEYGHDTLVGGLHQVHDHLVVEVVHLQQGQTGVN